MSTTTTTGPMNISPQNISGTCSYKCAYSYNYQKSNVTATNYGSTILLSYEVGTTPPVTFNNIKYNVGQIMLVSPSAHLFNNTLASAEIIITHIPVTGGNKLYVCIPISTSGASTKASQIITEIIIAISTGAPSQGERTNQGITEFSLNTVVPMTEFYTYNNNTANLDVIVFGLKDAISISEDTQAKLNAIIQPYTNTLFLSGPLLFLNPDGPTSGTGGDGEIYIDCNPTGSSDEEVDVTYDNVKPVTKFDLGNLFTNPIFLLIMSSLVFVIIILFVYTFLKYLTTGQVNITRRIHRND
jgi:carbonic anhydrase